MNSRFREAAQSPSEDLSVIFRSTAECLINIHGSTSVPSSACAAHYVPRKHEKWSRKRSRRQLESFRAYGCKLGCWEKDDAITELTRPRDFSVVLIHKFLAKKRTYSQCFFIFRGCCFVVFSPLRYDVFHRNFTPRNWPIRGERHFLSFTSLEDDIICNLLARFLKLSLSIMSITSQ